ncbi:MAG: hypothetical protein C3F11_08245 [Methylocystaceae bacterium]|nr:MAG: hypothetical protein C3F11_08245 [Methylocystaceae bacterium]
MDDQIKVEVTLERTEAAALLESLDHRLETLQRVEHSDGSELYAAAQREKAAIIPVIMALEAALKMPARHH